MWSLLRDYGAIAVHRAITADDAQDVGIQCLRASLQVIPIIAGRLCWYVPDWPAGCEGLPKAKDGASGSAA